VLSVIVAQQAGATEGPRAASSQRSPRGHGEQAATVGADLFRGLSCGRAEDVNLLAGGLAEAGPAGICESEVVVASTRSCGIRLWSSVGRCLRA
jgi:hypothetical protein